MSETVRYGVIGTGLMGIEHIHNLQALPGAEIVAVADPDQNSLNHAKSIVDSQTGLFQNHRDLLERGECDALVIATPNMTHTEILLEVLETGLPALVEKPLCTTVSDCKKVIEKAGNQSKIWVGLEYRYMPAIAELIRQVKEGKTGPISMVAIREHRFPFLKKVGDWNRFNDNTGGTLVEKCCHFFDLMRLISGSNPIRVFASGDQDVNHLDESYDGRVPDIIDNAYVIVDFESGARGMLDLCMFAEASHNQEEISVVGSLGKIEALVPESLVRTGIRGEHSLGNVDTKITSHSEIPYQGHHYGSSYIEHERFFKSVLENSPPESSLEDGLWSVAMGAAAHQSIEEGRAIKIEEVMRN